MAARLNQDDFAVVVAAGEEEVGRATADSFDFDFVVDDVAASGGGEEVDLLNEERRPKPTPRAARVPRA